jgi:hypothetical protein
MAFGQKMTSIDFLGQGVKGQDHNDLIGENGFWSRFLQLIGPFTIKLHRCIGLGQ